VLLLLVIEFLDEFVYGAREAAWPLIRGELSLSYAQIGVLLGLPALVSSIVEPFLGVLGDVWRRRTLILGGGLAFALALLLTALGQSYLSLLIAFVLLSPASGAFVSLSQASLMDLHPADRERNMARWSFAGSLGVVLGPVLLGVSTRFAQGWRAIFLATVVAVALVLAIARRLPLATPGVGVPDDRPWSSLLRGFQGALRALGRGDVRRWLVLLQFADLMLDVLLGYLALYMVDVAGVTSAVASSAVAVWTITSLIGGLVLIPLLTHLAGLRFLRWTAVIELALYCGLLLVDSIAAKLGFLALLGLFSAGWYSILQAQLYAALPDRSGTAIAVSNIAGLAGSALTWGLGMVAQGSGLSTAMWLLCLGPLALMVGLPSRLGPSSRVPRA
jgi:FSR family fosmidomycin resistance protein-like MFS transporter